MTSPSCRAEGIIFDLDGTLVDSEPWHLEAWNELVRRNGDLPDPGWNDDTIGLPDDFAAGKAIRLYRGLWGRAVPDLMEEKQEVFRAFVRREGPKLVFPGVTDALLAARRAGVAMAVGTNSVLLNAETTLQAAGIRELFASLVTIDRVERGKPSPDIYARAAEELGLSPERCAVIEDSQAGAQAGKAAGCAVMGVRSPHLPDGPPGADRMFAGTAQAVGWLLGLENGGRSDGRN